MQMMLRRRRNEKAAREFGAAFYTAREIDDATRYYVEPFCSSVDPAQEAEPRHLLVTEEKVFRHIDKFLDYSSTNRHLLVLAGSGMGKTSLVTNYYVRNLKKPVWKRRRIEAIPLGDPEAEAEIKKIENPKETVLFLDAFDEDPAALRDWQKRLHELLHLCRRVSRIVITSRTQFFPSAEEIPLQTGIFRFGARDLGDGGGSELWQIHISPFTDKQVAQYLRKRYPWWKLWRARRRKRAAKLIGRVPYLHVRPMLLTHIPQILKSGVQIDYSFQIYETMVEKWLLREERWVAPDVLRQFSELLAVSMYAGRSARGERVPRDELLGLASQWDIDLDEWQLTSRSLLNRDAHGNYKFAHRSIMEYLFALQAYRGNDRCHELRLSDQIRLFIWEMYNAERRENPDFHMDLSRLDLIGLQPRLRTKASRSLSRDDINRMAHRTRAYDQNYNLSSPGRLHLYDTQDLEGTTIVIDYASNLMIVTDPIHEGYSIADGPMKKFRDDRVGGYNDWRLPTLDELLSLLQSNENPNGMYIDPIFRGFSRRVFSADSLRGVSWIVSYTLGGCLPNDRTHGPCSVHPVRTFAPRSPTSNDAG